MDVHWTLLPWRSLARAVTIGCAAAVLLGCDEGSRGSGSGSGASRPTTTAPAEPAPSGAPDPMAMPPQVVALMGDGRLLVLSSDDGTVVRSLGTVAVGELFRPALSITPDRQFVYVSEAGKGDAAAADDAIGSIVQIHVSSGITTHVATGAMPRVSPDGRYLAYSTDADAMQVCIADALTVREVATGEERTWQIGLRPALRPARARRAVPEERVAPVRDGGSPARLHPPPLVGGHELRARPRRPGRDLVTRPARCRPIPAAKSLAAVLNAVPTGTAFSGCAPPRSASTPRAARRP